MFRKITPVTVFLIALIVLFVSIFFQINAKFKMEEKISSYRSSFDTLRLLEKEFNIFLLHPLGFVNYDAISDKQEKFSFILSSLEDSDLSEVYEYDFTSSLIKIREEYAKSLEVLEYKKSLHAMTINKISYLLDLHQTIDNASDVSDEEKRETNDIVFLLIQVLNGLDSVTDIKKKLISLKSGSTNENIDYFAEYGEVLLTNIQDLNLLPKEYLDLNLEQSIKNEMEKLDKLNALKVEQLESMSLIFSTVVAILLIILLILHRISLHNQESLKIAASVFKSIDEGILITDENQNIIDINEAITSIFGYTKEECIGKKPNMFQSGEYAKSFYDNMWESINKEGKWAGRINDCTKNGTIIVSWLSIHCVKDRNGNILNYIAIHKDISEIIESQAHIDFLAYHDSLTRLPNRVSFEESLHSSIKHAQRENGTMALLFVDLDRFKIINDSLGHDVGDKLLQEVAQRLKKSIRELDSLFRIGGDEFVVIIERVDAYFALAKIAKKIVKQISKPFSIEDYVLNTTASIGISQYPKDTTNAIDLVKYADSAMYEAKENGKNTYSFYTDKLSKSLNTKLKIEQNLRIALKEKELYLHFQPQYLLKSKKIIAVESLVRWNDKRLGVIGPDHFIPIAEESGLIIDIGYFVFRESCLFMKELREKGIFLEQIAVNVSSQQFSEAGIVTKFLKIVKEYDLTPDLIEIEITERYIMESTRSDTNIIDDLKAEGFKISIDDFGTGYSSMSYLKSLAIDTIKIDKSFVDDLPHSSNDVAIAKAIITLSNSLNHHTVAEGIQTQEQEEFLAQEGCEIGQGYYFSKPLSKSECIEFIAIQNQTHAYQ